MCECPSEDQAAKERRFVKCAWRSINSADLRMAVSSIELDIWLHLRLQRLLAGWKYLSNLLRKTSVHAVDQNRPKGQYVTEN
jgi:hypothetical protein